jgi:Carboxypeptidase regulatory-like domain/TonB dependent receptor
MIGRHPIYTSGIASTLTAVICAVALLLYSSNTSAQDPNGALRGKVQDASGARIPGAKVTATASGSSVVREATANSKGEFRIDDLLPGPYSLSVSAASFAPADANVEVVVSTVRDVVVTLKPQSVRARVSVESEPISVTTEPVDTASAVHQGTVTGHDLQTLPLAGRSFANIAYLVPGTEPVEPSDPTKARITAVSTGGSSGLNNELSVDGGDNSDDWIGGFLQNFSPDGIQEFAVRTANEDADTGWTTAGSVVITTKHGTNDWHGDAAFFERDASLNARFPIENPAPDPKQPFSRQNYVGTLGGPIARNKLWFFTSFEFVHENASIAYSPASQAQFQALQALASDGLIPGVSSITLPSNVPIPFRDYLGSVRFDWAQSAKSQWFLRTSTDTYLTHNALVQQGALPNTGLTTHNNYFNTVLSNQYTFSPNWLGSFVFGASELHLTQTRNSDLGFALGFPFTSTSQTISGFETFGDNQFTTPITLFPTLRNQEKYQFRYDVSHVSGSHAPKFGIDFIHEPVLSGAFPATAESFTQFVFNPADYLNPQVVPNGLAQFSADLTCATAPDGTPLFSTNTNCSSTPAGDGSFAQNVQRLALYAEDSWRATPHLTINYGLRWQTTFGLFKASGLTQAANPSFALLPSLGYPETVPHDYRKQFGPRIGIAYTPGDKGNTVIRAGFGIYYNDLAQSGWATALQSLNPNSIAPPSLIDPNYRTPYAIHATGGLERAINSQWTVSADYTHEQGNHAYRAYPYDTATVFRSDNRSSYNALMLRLQGNMTKRFSLVANYTLAKAETWGCVLGELFDYVNGVCDPNNAFAPGDYGPSGEDVRHRFVLAGTLHIPAGIELTTLTQAESARPFTIVNADSTGRISVNGVPESLDEVRGTPYVQVDLRVARPFHFGDRLEINPFVEFFNLFNRNNPGANYVTNITLLPVPAVEAQAGNITNICTNPLCTATQPIASINQLRVAGGALGDFFGPGTTVGIPFAAQLGIRVTF